MSVTYLFCVITFCGVWNHRQLYRYSDNSVRAHWQHHARSALAVRTQLERKLHQRSSVLLVWVLVPLLGPATWCPWAGAVQTCHAAQGFTFQLPIMEGLPPSRLPSNHTCSFKQTTQQLQEMKFKTTIQSKFISNISTFHIYLFKWMIVFQFSQPL